MNTGTSIRMRALLLVLATGFLGVGSSCNKPEEGDCKKALSNVQRLRGTSQMLDAGNLAAAVRSCRGTSSKASVQCAIEAQSIEALEKCDFMKDKKPK